MTVKRLFVLTLFTLLVSGVRAQEGTRADIPPGAIIEAVVGDVFSLSALDLKYCGEVECDIAALLFPRLLGVDAATQTYSPFAPGIMASWEVSPDLREFTLYLWQGRNWSDGTPITARDVQFTLEAYQYDLIDLEQIETVDHYTVRVTFSSGSCRALDTLNVGILPAHKFESPDEVGGSDFSQRPDISAGPFVLDTIGDDWIYLRPNPNYPSGVRSSGYVFRFVDDEASRITLLRDGEVDILRHVPPEYVDDLESAVGVRVFEYTGEVWNYIGLNAADPNGSLEGINSAGTLLDQGHHPLFGDVQVRQALQYAIDVNAIIEAVGAGSGVPFASYIPPGGPSANANLRPIPYDPAEAARLLDAAGWHLGANGIRRARGALYAADGTPLSFQLLTTSYSAKRVTIAEVVRQQLLDVGVDMEIVETDFSALFDSLNTQDFDAYLFAWASGFPPRLEPDYFLAKYDSGDGVNFGSFQNVELERLAEQADAVPNCDPLQQRNISYQMQELVQREQPYLWLYAESEYVAARNSVRGFNPYPHLPLWNVHEWSVFR